MHALENVISAQQFLALQLAVQLIYEFTDNRQQPHTTRDRQTDTASYNTHHT